MKNLQFYEYDEVWALCWQLLDAATINDFNFYMFDGGNM